MLTFHLPRRPDWRCQVCREPWPCLGARGDLLVVYADERASLGQYLAAQMMDAVIDLRRPLDPAMYDRFLGWVRPREPRPSWLRVPVVYHRSGPAAKARLIMAWHVQLATAGCAVCGSGRCRRRAAAIRSLRPRGPTLVERRRRCADVGARPSRHHRPR